PHMTVFENVAYPLRAARQPEASIAQKVKEMLGRVRCDHLASQHPADISGGQQQRVALARALVAGSKVVLFDEPMSNVDAGVRAQLRVELIDLQRSIGFSALYITHDQSEALALADRIAVLDSGRIAQLGAPQDIYRRPGSPYVARFVGTVNEMRGTVQRHSGDEIQIACDFGPVIARVGADSTSWSAMSRALVMHRPEQVRLSGGRPPGPNAWPVTVRAVLFLGAHLESIVDLAGVAVRVWHPEPAAAAVGASAWLSVDPEHVMVFPVDIDDDTSA
ncbi:MAG: ABC transporter ATP-binding protein, partial [Gammaproteobacteria bacterium]|nr:ABC transporter ATP-binding protein [Gammaproteobacteria bacterium]